MLTRKRSTPKDDFTSKKQKISSEKNTVDATESASKVLDDLQKSNSDLVNEKTEDSSENEDNSSNDSEEYSSEEEDDFIQDELNKITGDKTLLENNYSNAKKEIERTEPNIQELLSTPLRIEDRTKLVHYYNIYKNTIPNTEEWLETRTKYNYLFNEFKQGYKQYMQFSETEHNKMKEEEDTLTSFDAQLALKYKILALNTTKENKSVIFRRYEELLSLENTNEEYGKLKHWLKWATEIPHDIIKHHKVDNITTFIKEASYTLDKELYGMQKIKEQILLFLSAKIMNPNMKRSNLGLVGPPGVGKTAIARLIAKLLDTGFEQISFGGIDKADFLKGHEYTYVGAQPGEIVKCLKRMQHKNGIIFLDELDKAAEHPDISAALLHLIDQSQNYDFRDNFLGEISIDLSHIWYIGSMNQKPLDEALVDRWWIIDVNGYTISEKITIIKNYLLPKALKNINMADASILFDDISAKYFIQKVSKENDKGIRTIQKSIQDLINKLHFIITHQDEDGKLPFVTSFHLNIKINTPLTLNQKIIDKLIENKELSQVLNMMYI